MPCCALDADSRDPWGLAMGQTAVGVGSNVVCGGKPSRTRAAGKQAAPQCAAVPGRRSSDQALPRGRKSWGNFKAPQKRSPDCLLSQTYLSPFIFS